MKQHERDFFVSIIRSGVTYLEFSDIGIIEILSPTHEDYYYINKAYIESYKKNKADGVLEQDEILQIMINKGLWTQKDDDRIKGLEDDIEKLTLNAYENRRNEGLLKHIRHGVKVGKEQLSEIKRKKAFYTENSVEGFASIERCVEQVNRCTFKDGEKLELDHQESLAVWSCYLDALFEESTIRDLARSEPWRSTWVLKGETNFPIFGNPEGRDLTVDQKNLLIWSKTYDNIKETPECPDDYVIKDDLLLDGWFISQAKKNEAEKSKQDVEQSITNSKIANSSEIFVMASSEKEAEKINKANNMHARMVKKQREAVIQSKGKAKDMDFQDNKLAARRQQIDSFKGRFK